MALHEHSLYEGAEVTIVWRESGKLTLRHCRVVGHESDGRIRMVTSGGSGFVVNYDSEGVRWIRGHARAGYDGKALLAAAQLRAMIE